VGFSASIIMWANTLFSLSFSLSISFSLSLTDDR
jgi:hypothetical protein